MVKVKLLGPVEVWAGGASYAVGPPQRRLVLAALAHDTGAVVALEVLAARVWDAVPDNAARILQVHLSQLRQLGAKATPGRALLPIVRRSGGYLLNLAETDIDLPHFRRLIADSHSTPDSEQRIALLAQALRYWHPQPLTGVTGMWAEAVRQACRSQHLEAVLGWAEALLAQGRAGDALGPLLELARDHPLAERRAVLTMRALAATGRRVEALDHYQHIAKSLSDELGIGPGQALEQAFLAILRDDGGERVHLSRPAVVAQLPMPIARFTGRNEELALLDLLVEAPTKRSLCVVSGIAGVGKTALVLHWAQRARHRFPDGQVYLDLRGFGPDTPMTPIEALRQVLESMGTPSAQIPQTEAAASALYRSIMADKRMLIVLDNAASAAQIRPLLPASTDCVVVVTSRDRLPSLLASHDAALVAVDVFDPAEAETMLVDRIGRRRAGTEPEALSELVDLCARLPLALAIVAARTVSSGTLTLRRIADDLGEAASRLDLFPGTDIELDIRAAFSWSYQALSTPAANLFRLLGLHPGPDFDVVAAASLIGESTAAARRLLAELNGANLLSEQRQDRYRFHDLIQTYARELATSEVAVPDRYDAMTRLLDHYLHSAYGAALTLNPYRHPIALDPPAHGVTPVHFADEDEAMNWFHTERRTLMAAAAEADFPRHAWQLAWALGDFLDRRGQWADWAAVQQTALDCAEDPSAKARLLRGLARAMLRLDRMPQAQTHLTDALSISESLGDHTGQAHTLLELARIAGHDADWQQAYARSQRACQLFDKAGNTSGTATALNVSGWFLCKLGRYEQALVHCEQALALQRQLVDDSATAATLDSLGYIHTEQARYEQAAAHYQEALTLYRRIGNLYYQAEILQHLGDMHARAGNSDQSAAYRREADAILTDIGHPPTSD